MLPNGYNPRPSGDAPRGGYAMTSAGDGEDNQAREWWRVKAAELSAELGFEIPPREQQTPEALGLFQKAEIEKWWPIIKAANIRGE